MDTRKIYIRKNNNKVDSVKTGRMVIAVASLKLSRKMLSHCAFSITYDKKFYHDCMI